MLFNFKREYRCFECGHVGKYSCAEDAVCCGRSMVRGVHHSAPEGAPRIDIVKPLPGKSHPVRLRPSLKDVWEVWALSPGRKTAASELIGWMGQNGLGMWEFAMASGYAVSDGLAPSREEAARRMMEIAEGGLPADAIRTR